MPYTILIRTDIPNGTLQIDDLWPNKSQRNSVTDPVGQGPIYVRAPENERVFTGTLGSDTAVRSDFRGLAAYFLDRAVNADYSPPRPITAVNANAIADAVIAAARAGDPLTKSDIGDIIQDANSDYGLGKVVVQDVLRILSGQEYLLPGGSRISNGNDKRAPSGSFTSDVPVQVYYVGSFESSMEVGKIASLASSTFRYRGTTGAAVVVYADDGTVLVG